MIGCNTSRTLLFGWLIALGALAFVPVTVRATPTIFVGPDPNNTTVSLQANTVGQTFGIYIVGGDPISGITLDVETGFGGTANLNPNAYLAPAITQVDLFGTAATAAGGIDPNGAVFDANHTTYGVNTGPSGSQFWESDTTTTGTSYVAAGGANTPQLLAVVTIDTTGFFSGTFAVTLDDQFNGKSEYADIGGQQFPNVVDGFIQIGQIVPEPASLGLLMISLGGLLMRRRGRPSGQ